MGAALQDLWSTSKHQWLKQQHTHLVPDSMTTLACLIPLGMRSLMTSRMIKDPMKAYSADYTQKRQSKQTEWDKTVVTRNKRGSVYILTDPTKLTCICICICICICVYVSLSVSALSLPWRRGRDGSSAAPHITGAVWDESEEKRGRSHFVGNWDNIATQVSCIREIKVVQYNQSMKGWSRKVPQWKHQRLIVSIILNAIC